MSLAEIQIMIDDDGEATASSDDPVKPVYVLTMIGLLIGIAVREKGNCDCDSCTESFRAIERMMKIYTEERGVSETTLEVEKKDDENSIH